MGKKINYLQRLIATGLAFLFWGIAGALSQLLLYPYAKRTDFASHLKIRKIVGKIWLYFIRYLQWSGVLEVKYVGFERLGQAGQLVIANHPSLLDVVLILSQKPELNCIVKQDLLNNPTMRNQILACGFLPNNQSLELLDDCDRVLQQQALLLFPEGTRTGWDNVVKLNRGAVSIGLRSAKIITPVVIKMSPLALKKGQPWYKIPPQKMCYQFIVGEDIDPQQWLKDTSIPMASRRLTKHLEDYFNSATKDNNKWN
ncbi:lysophospholipid acyltransferase family protein [Volucribacter amazonae]|uniref:Acyl-phosphate glycerol 3-phosphate acyltransferase n=1 Tax=Volucribacter amazonae TaxID=256731 RepID=A0A9X4PDP5_9PAST|nr:lysophospholipid acyltransferase family protein [Volucribacter amazonae]MDG6896267.1 acyl-phosphate glycerol 3-phosphate acyltransferase [Volucribacter amazonae]